MKETFKNLCLVFLGMVLAVGILALIIFIGSRVNGIEFGEQIVQWFGTVKEVVDTGTEQIPEVTAMLKI